MVGKLKLAFVNFHKEARGRKVVRIRKIVGFSPKSHTDFDEDSDYSVLWPHFPTDESFSTEGEFDAKIYCLGVDRQDLIHEAALKGLKIPLSCFEEMDGEQTPTKELVKSSSVLTTNEKRVDGKGQDTKSKNGKGQDTMSKNGKGQDTKSKNVKGKDEKNKNAKQKDEKSKDAKRKGEKSKNGKEKDERGNNGKVNEGNRCTTAGRKSTIVSSNPPLVYRSPPFSNKLNDVCETESDKIFGIKLRSKKQSKVEEVMFDRMRGELESEKISSKERAKVENEIDLGQTTSKCRAPLVSGLLSDKGRSEDDFQLQLQETMPVISDTESLHDACALQKSIELVDRKRTKERSSAESSTSVSLSSWASNQSQKGKDSEIDLYVKKILRIETELKQTKRENVELKQKLAVSEQTVKDLMSLNFELQKKIFNARNVDTPIAGESKAVKRKLYDKDETVYEQNQDTTPHKSFRKRLKELTPQKSTPQKSTPQKSTPQKSTPQKSTPPRSIVPRRTPQTLTTKMSTPRKTSTPGSAKTLTPGSAKSSPGSKYATESDLAPMIRDALTGKTPLQSDGAGKVHLGNNVWVKESIFNDKLAKTKTEPTIALRDAMTCIYSTEEMAERSLDGGKPVRGDKTKTKLKMTPHKREALLGLYRAKALLKSTDVSYLDLALKKGRTTIRDRLNEAQKFLNKQAEKQDDPQP